MISVIICSKNSELFSKASESIAATIGLPFEIVKIDNHGAKYGICEAYNLGAARAKFSFLCFCHEDLIFHTTNWGEKIVAHLMPKETGAIGVFGTSLKTKAPSAPWIGDNNLDKVNHLQTGKDGSPYLKYANSLNESASQVILIDGMFMCCRKEVWEEFKFDEVHFRGFHGYDVDFSLQVAQKYKLFIIYDVNLEHLSEGVYSSGWIDSMIFISQKWKRHLPLSITSLSPQQLRSWEYRNYLRFLWIMAKNGKINKQAFIYFLKAFSMKPGSLEHLKLVKHFLKNISKN